MRISDWSSDVCFSDLSARLLRERYGFKGELRAVGNVLRDQLFFMLRCGFDAFEIDNPDAVAAWRDAVAEIDLFYQPAGNSGPRSEEHTSELQSLMRISYAVFCFHNTNNIPHSFKYH